jgi:hypothetical protein
MRTGARLLLIVCAIAPAGRAAAEPADSLRTPESFHLRHRFLRTAGLIVVTDMGILVYNRTVDETPDHHLRRDNIHDNLQNGFEWDDNRFYVNYVFHPYQGSLYFDFGRANGYGYWQSMLWTFAGSWMWEYLYETNNPSVNDWINSGLGGAAMGEPLFRMSGAVLDNTARGGARFWRELVGFVIAPARGFNRLFTGESWRVHANPRDRRPGYGLGQVRLGYRWLEEDTPDPDVSEENPFVRVDALYGDPFSRSGTGPFRHFYFGMMFNLDDPDFAIARIRIDGLLGGTVHGGAGRRHFAGAFQHFYYAAHDAYEFGAQGFSASYLGRYPAGKMNLFFGARLHGVVLGATTTDYYSYTGRNYDYGPGLGYELSLSLGGTRAGDYLTLDHRGYYIDAINGNDADHFVSFTRASAWLPVGPVAAGVDYILYLAERRYADFPDVSARNGEVRAYLGWVLR